MKTNKVSPLGRLARTDAADRAQLLAAFDRSGLSARRLCPAIPAELHDFLWLAGAAGKTRAAP